MSKREEFSQALKESMKNKDQVAVSTIRLIMAALKEKDISAREKGNSDGISDEEIMSLLQSMVKQRRESSKVYGEAGRQELADREELEIKVIESFLPEQMDESEIEEVVKSIIEDVGASGIRDMGKIMGVLKSEYAGRVDMGKAGAIAKKCLAG